MRGNGSVFSITEKIKDKRLERSWGVGGWGEEKGRRVKVMMSGSAQ
jgi:hypothetical protein